MRHSHLTSRRILLSAALLASAAPAWSQTNEDVKLLGTGVVPSAQLGYSVAVDGNLIISGAVLDGNLFSTAGSAYVFDSTSGALISKLVPTDSAAGDRFGFSVAAESGLVVVGAPTDDDLGADSGSAYLFDARSGTQLAKFVASDGAAGSQFGSSIAVSNGIVAIGAHFDNAKGADSGAAYLFDLATGQQLAKLVAADGAAGDHFGAAISIDNGTVVVGAPDADLVGMETGAAYIFDASTGTQLAKLGPASSATDIEFGASVALSGDTAVIGAPNAGGSVPFTGAAYLYDIHTGLQTAFLLAFDGASGDRFGESVGISNGAVAISARANDDLGSASGSAYTFDASTGLQTAKLLPSDGAFADFFGSSIAIENGRIAVGADGDNDVAINSGSVYGFTAGASQSTITAYGVGLGGVNTGSLASTSAPDTGATVQFDISGFSTSGAALLLLSSTSAHSPFAGGTALVSLTSALLVKPFTLTAGAATVQLAIPAAPSLIGTSFYSQSGALDATQPLGITLSNAISIYIGQ